MKILVVGLGYVGGMLASELAARGHEVIGVRRSDGPTPVGVRVVRGDVTSSELWQHLPDAFDQIAVLLSAGQRSEVAYERTYFGGALAVRRAFPSARLVWVSSTAVYAEEDDVLVTDETLPRAALGTAAVLLRAEAAAATGPHLIVRPSGIYGPGRTTLLGRLLRAEIQGAERELWTNRIHSSDLAATLSFCIDRPELDGTLIASDREPAQLGSMQDWVQSELADRMRQNPIGSEEGVPPVATAAASSRAEARKSRRILASRLTALGFSWRYPSYREGYAPLLDDAAA